MLDTHGAPRQWTGEWSGLVKVLVFAGALLLILVACVINLYVGVAALALLLASLALGLNLRWSLLALIFFLPFDPQIELKPGFYFYFDLLFVLPALVYIWKATFTRISIPWAALAMAPYVLFAIGFGFWRAENFLWFAGYSVRLVVAVLFMLTIAGVGRVESITLALGASMVPQVIIGISQLLVDGPGALYLLIYPHYEEQIWTERARALFFTENNFGSYCATVSVMLLALALKAKVHQYRLACCVLAFVGFVGVAIAGSRGAWLGAFAGLTILFLFSRAPFGAKVAVAAAAVLGAVAAQWIPFAPWSRVETLDTFTLDTRLTIYLAALLLFIQHPIIGVGLTNHQALMSSVVNWTYGQGNAAHNTYLQILSENGSIGFVLFFVPIFYFFYRNLKGAGNSTNSLVSAAGITVFLVHGLFDFQLMTAPQYLFLFAILLGLSSKVFLDPVLATPA
jgi:hypothetical protein